MVVVSADMSNEEIIDAINSEIDTRRSYGTRVESAGGRAPWRRLVWSAGNSYWYQHYDAQRGPSTLDANEIGVAGISRIRLEGLLEELNSLPLHIGSIEARLSGGYSLEGIEIPPGLRESFGIKQKTLGEFGQEERN